MKTITTLTLVTSASFVSAQTFSLNDIVNWTGTGSNESALIIDWQDGTTHPALAWGYRWDGAATGEQMLLAIAAADPDLTVTMTTYSFGDAVDSLGFNGDAYGPNGPGSHYQNGFGTGGNGFWSYYIGSGASLPAWTESAVGFGDNPLSNDSWDGWSWAANFNDTPPSDPIIPAPNPSPEPGSLAVLAFGIGALALRRAKRA